jgi:methionine-rich copper-binding protein CopC
MSRFLNLTLAAALVAVSTAAFAHAQLESATPAVGSTVASANELKLEYSEGVEPKFTSVALTGPSGPVSVGKPVVVGGDAKVIVVKFAAPLAPGEYTVSWKAVSVDTHHTQGTFQFTVKP